MVARWLIGACGFGAALVVLAGCGGSVPASEGTVPASATIVPANAVAYVTIVSDSSSEQWRRADRLLSLIPGARDDLLAALEGELAAEGLSWRDDVEPALGPEVVVVVTADRRPVLLTQPEDVAKLDALLSRRDESAVRGGISGWTAIAEREADIDAYRTALGHGTLESNTAFASAMEALPADSVSRAWVDLSSLTAELDRLLEESGTSFQLGLDSLSAAVSAEEDGVLVAMSLRAPDGAFGTRYEPKLFGNVPADAVAVLSFGGTQGALDRLRESVDLDAIADELRDETGVSLQGVLDAFSGEGVLYVRPDGSIPEVTLVLAPPDADEAFENVDRLVRTLSEDLGGRLERTMQDAIEVTRLVTEEVTLSYARLDEDSVIVTTGTDAIADFLGDTSTLADTDGFARAADAVELGARTGGFVYIDVDGIVALVDDAAGPDSFPVEAREILEALDSFILQSSGDDDTTRVQGFLRVDG